MDAEHGSTARARVEWPSKAERSWCAGASRPRPAELQAGSLGWTSFFRMQGVVDRLKHKLVSQRERTASHGTTAASENGAPTGPEPESLVRDSPSELKTVPVADSSPSDGSSPRA